MSIVLDPIRREATVVLEDERRLASLRSRLVIHELSHLATGPGRSTLCRAMGVSPWSLRDVKSTKNGSGSKAG